MLAAMKDETRKRRGRGRPIDPNSRNQQLKGTSRYQPTKAELEEEIQIDATFEELMDAMFSIPRDQRRPGRVVPH